MEKEKRRFEDDAEARRWLLECLDGDSPEYQLVGWLGHGMAEPAIMAARYFHYVELSRQANAIISNRYDDKTLEWLRHNYCITAGFFYWSMETYCHNMCPKVLIDQGHRCDPEDLPIPEFSLNMETVKVSLIENENSGRLIAKGHQECADRIYKLCDSQLTELSEEMEMAYRTPLCILATASKHIATCIELRDLSRKPEVIIGQ